MSQQRPDRTLGPGHDEFWGWCKLEELRLPRCSGCEKLAWPVVPACEHCGGASFTWELLSGRGKVVSWCSFEQDYYQGMFTLPHDTILVELEEGPLFISNPIDFNCQLQPPGFPVKVTFLDCEDSSGTFKLPVFAPL